MSRRLPPITRRIAWRTPALLALVAPLHLACASIDPQPFAKFSLSLQEFRESSDAALQITETENREVLVDLVVAETGRGDASTVSGALLLEPDPPFGWSYEAGEAPLYVESRRFRAGVQAVNDALVTYAGLLAELAAPELVDADRFDAMAGDLNGNLRAAAGQLGVGGAGAEQGIALFSTAASAAARAYIEGRRQDQLLDMLEETQQQVEAWSARLVRAMEIAGRNTTASYQNRSNALALGIPGASDSARRKRIEALLELNDRYTSRLRALARMAHAYGSLPVAHNELRRSVERPGIDLATVKNIYQTGKELHALYAELEASDAR